MVNLDILNKYMITFDDFSLNIIKGNIEEIGSIEAAFNKQLFYLDCSRVYPDGTRPMQTIGYPYRRELAAAIYMAQQMEDAIKEEWLLKLIELHQKNIEYEKINPPIWYDGEKGKKKFEKNIEKLPRRKNTIKNGTTTPKQDRTKLNNLKLNLLKINIKPISK